MGFLEIAHGMDRRSPLGLYIKQDSNISTGSNISINIGEKTPKTLEKEHITSHIMPVQTA